MKIYSELSVEAVVLSFRTRCGVSVVELPWLESGCGYGINAFPGHSDNMVRSPWIGVPVSTLTLMN